MIPLWANPEFIRNCRAQLRPRRLVLVASVIAALSLVLGYSMYQAYALSEWGTTLLSTVLYVQIFSLFLGGGIACSRSISTERDQNTFDFQRVTQLTSLELAVGKLFGAPAMAYCAVLCMMPAALVGAVAAAVPLTRLAAAYLILFAAGVAVHSLTLLFSMGTSKTAGGAGGLIGMALLCVLLLITSFPDASRLVLDLGPIGPYAVTNFALHGTWDLKTRTLLQNGPLVADSAWTDIFFGVPVHHLPVLLVLYVSFTFWCLAPLSRSLKRDPDLMELYSPGQSVGLLAYLNLILVGFYLLFRPADYMHMNEYRAGSYGPRSLSSTFDFFLTVNLMLLYCLGLALLRNREQTRRRAHQRRASGFDWSEAGWPAAYILAGAACAAALFLARFGRIRWTVHDLQPSFAVFVGALLVATMLRDLCFLQWMSMRRSKRPLLLGVVLLGVFYTCGGLLLGMANFSEPVQMGVTAAALPWPLAITDPADQAAWLRNPGPYFIGLALQIALATLFAALHYKSVEELRPAGSQSHANAPATGD